MFMWKPVEAKKASSIDVRFAARSAGTRPSPVGTSEVVSEMPSWASRYGIFATEAAEAWMAAEHESPARAAEEISQLLYRIQVLMLGKGLTLDDVYQYL